MSASFRIIDRYVLLDQLADGGTASVYRAFQSSAQGVGRLIVMKTFKADYLAASKLSQQDHQRQIQTMVGLSHPNIVQLYDVGEERPGVPYVVMEYIHGKSLRQLILGLLKARMILRPDFVAYLGKEISQALHYAHQFQGTLGENHSKVLHRNLGPQNVMISYDGEVKLIEFGVVGDRSENTATQTSFIRGRSGYTSPEELTGQPLDPRSDLFSLGVLLWECLVGKSLFTSENRKATHDKIKDLEKHVRAPSSIHATIPKEFDVIILKLLERDPEKRYASALDVANAFDRILALTYPDFGKATFQSFMNACFKDEMAQEAKKIQALVADAEKVSKNVVPTGKTAFLKKFQQEGDTDESEEERIMMSKQIEGASGAREIDALNLVKESEINLNTDDLKNKKTAQRGGFVRRSNHESEAQAGGSGVISSVGSFDKEMFQTPQGSQRVNPNGKFGKMKKAEGPRAPAQYAWVTQAVFVALIVFLVLPYFGIKLWSIPSMVEKIAELTSGRKVASEPTSPKP